MSASSSSFGPRRILVATDFADYSQHALDYARALAHAQGASIVLHTSLDLPDPHTMVGGALKPMVDLAAVEQAASDSLEFEAKRAQLGQMLVGTDVGRYRPEDEIPRAAREHGCDLVVVGTRGHTGVERFVLGSVSERVAATSQVPVLVIPPRDDD
mgnify:CR=1 FL=1